MSNFKASFSLEFRGAASTFKNDVSFRKVLSATAILLISVGPTAQAEPAVTSLPPVSVDAPPDKPRATVQQKAVRHSVAGARSASHATNRSGVTRRSVSARETVVLAPAPDAGLSAPAVSVGRPATIVQGYVPLSTTAGAKTETPIIEIPQAISVVTREQLDDRNVQTLSQALDYTASVRAGAFGFDPRFDSFYLRGFDMTYTGIYRDGLHQPAAPFGIYKTEPYGLEAIVAIKGPSSALYGLGSPGGLIDLQTKRPPLQALREIQLQLGNYDRYQGNFDLGGPLDPQGVYSYRLTGLFRDSDTWLPGAKDNRDYIAPAFAWRPDASTSLTFLGEYMNSGTTGNPAFYQTPEGVLTHIYQSDPQFTNFDQDQMRIGYEFEHKFDGNITFKQNARYARVFADVKYTQLDFVDFETGLGTRSTGRIINHLTTFGVDNQILARFSTGPVDHTLLGGLEYTYSQFNNKIGFGAAPDLSIYPTPAYGALPINPPDSYSVQDSQKQDQLALYAQDQAKLGPMILTLSGRRDRVDTKTNDEVAYVETRQHDSAFTGRAGLTYVSPIGLAPYANYATSFAPTLGTDANQQPFKSITGEQKEVGVKYQPPGINALLQAAWFDIYQSHITVPDPNDTAFQIQTGAVRSRGFEIEGVASLGAGLNASLSYSHLNLKFASGEAETVGKTPSGIPQDTFSAWVGYTIQPGNTLAGLGGGLGVRYIGANFGDDQNTFKTAATTVFDGNLHYDLSAINPALKGVRLQVNAQNLFDREYETCQSGYCYYGPKRTVIGSLRYRW